MPEAVGLRTHPMTGVVQGALWAAAASVGLVSSVFSGDGWGTMSPIVSLLIALVGGLVVGMVFGYLSWRFTRYVIDGDELRINSGIITKASRRIPYERIQSVDIAEPFVARLFGLAELRIEMAGGKDSRTSLRFLELDDARALRRVLLARAHGDTQTGVIADEKRSIITVVSPQRVVIGTLLSLDFLAAAAGLVTLVVLAVYFDQVLVLLGGIVPLGSWVVQIVGKRVIQQWNFTLSRGDRGLRIERGLLSRSSQTIPYSRVQGIAIKEPFVWRRLGWQRLEVDIAGYAAQSDDQGTESTSTLLPISDPSLAAAIIAELIPGAMAESVARTAAPRRSWVFAPIGWRSRWIGADDDTFVAREGWIERSTSIVPHNKTQSVELRQGPLARWRRIATIEVHTPKGPANADGRNLDEHDARDAMLAQLIRARASRA
ncbi:PH domain-containing protein [Aeromicrobium sp.]|uniref:PH domain-containing protein n=1 Tax=Aeromicrobium sp. TaxID=1871063 RepID=UPI0019B9FDD1|nr:PH domain-containing protein [Aeromicrobium sp.]MBC7632726.1 PH domain-containing protein [Aeromicrobium sp.]